MVHIIYPKTCHNNLLLQSLQSIGMKVPLFPFRNICSVIGSNMGSLHKKLATVFDLQITSVDQGCQNLCKIVGFLLMQVSSCAMLTCLHPLNRLSLPPNRITTCKHVPRTRTSKHTHGR